MSRSRVEGLLKDVELALKELDTTLREIESLSVTPNQDSSFQEVFKALTNIKQWIVQRKKFLGEERQTSLNQALDAETQIFQNRVKRRGLFG